MQRIVNRIFFVIISILILTSCSKKQEEIKEYRDICPTMNIESDLRTSQVLMQIIGTLKQSDGKNFKLQYVNIPNGMILYTDKNGKTRRTKGFIVNGEPIPYGNKILKKAEMKLSPYSNTPAVNLNANNIIKELLCKVQGPLFQKQYDLMQNCKKELIVAPIVVKPSKDYFAWFTPLKWFSDFLSFFGKFLHAFWIPLFLLLLLFLLYRYFRDRERNNNGTNAPAENAITSQRVVAQNECGEECNCNSCNPCCNNETTQIKAFGKAAERVSKTITQSGTISMNIELGEGKKFELMLSKSSNLNNFSKDDYESLVRNEFPNSNQAVQALLSLYENLGKPSYQKTVDTIAVFKANM